MIIQDGGAHGMNVYACVIKLQQNMSKSRQKGKHQHKTQYERRKQRHAKFDEERFDQNTRERHDSDGWSYPVYRLFSFFSTNKTKKLCIGIVVNSP